MMSFGRPILTKHQNISIHENIATLENPNCPRKNVLRTILMNEATKDRLSATILSPAFWIYFMKSCCFIFQMIRDREHIPWGQNPFEVDVPKLSLSSEDESKLIELLFDRSPKLKFEAVGHADCRGLAGYFK